MRLVLAAALLATAPVVAQTPGAPDVSRVKAGGYTVDPAHTQVLWTVDHMGISPLTGLFAVTAGTLTLDPAKPAATKVSVTIDTAMIVVTAPAFARHLGSADLFDSARFPTATFTSTTVTATGAKAKIVGNLTIKGITKPVTLDAGFVGAGDNPMSKQANIGFQAHTTIRRSDFGLGMAVPAVSDEVKVTIHAAFVRR